MARHDDASGTKYVPERINGDTWAKGKNCMDNYEKNMSVRGHGCGNRWIRCARKSKKKLTRAGYCLRRKHPQSEYGTGIE